MLLFILLQCKSVYSSDAYLKDLRSNGFSITEKAEGDIGLDGTDDLAVVISKGEDDVFERKLVVFIENGKGKPQQIFENDTVIGEKDSGGLCCPDPFQGIEITDGVLKIDHMTGDCLKTSSELSFRYDRSARDLFFDHLSITDFSACENTPETMEGKDYLITNPALQKIAFEDYEDQAENYNREDYSIDEN